MKSSTVAAPVVQEVRGNIQRVAIHNPPVNALSAEVRCGLLAVIESAEVNATVRVVLIVGAGRNFIAGADIREFGK